MVCSSLPPNGISARRAGIWQASCTGWNTSRTVSASWRRQLFSALPSRIWQLRKESIALPSAVNSTRNTSGGTSPTARMANSSAGWWNKICPARSSTRWVSHSSSTIPLFTYTSSQPSQVRSGVCWPMRHSDSAALAIPVTRSGHSSPYMPSPPLFRLLHRLRSSSGLRRC